LIGLIFFSSLRVSASFGMSYRSPVVTRPTIVTPSMNFGSLPQEILDALFKVPQQAKLLVERTKMLSIPCGVK